MTSPEFDEVELQGLRAVAMRAWPADTPPPQLRLLVERALGQMVLEVRAMAFGEKHPEPVIFRAPADWREAVKERWLPRWLLARWPVRYRVQKVEVWNIYPEFTNRHLSRRIRVAVRSTTHEGGR